MVGNSIILAVRSVYSQLLTVRSTRRILAVATGELQSFGKLSISEASNLAVSALVMTVPSWSTIGKM